MNRISEVGGRIYIYLTDSDCNVLLTNVSDQ